MSPEARNLALQVALRQKERMYRESAARVSELEDAAILVLRQFADVREDCWPTAGMRVAIEELDKAVHGDAG